MELIAVADRLLSGGGFSMQLGPGSKVVPLYNPNAKGGANWLLGFAGDTSWFLPIREAIRAITTDDSSGDEVVEAARAGYVAQRRRVFEQTVLSPFGLDVPSLLSKGRAIFGEDEFNRLCCALTDFDFRFQLVLGGWSKAKQQTRLVSIENPGVVIDHFIEGAVAIGEGAALAAGHLWATYNRYGSRERALYRVVEAKFISEATRSVGPDTTVFVMDFDGGIRHVLNDNCEKLRVVWSARRKNVPKAHAALLEVEEMKWIGHPAGDDIEPLPEEQQHKGGD